MKRILAILLSALMLLSLCACKGGDNGGDNEQKIEPLDEEEAAIIKSLGETGLNGYEFTVVDFSDSRWNKEQEDHTPYLDAWQNAMDAVEALYNCKISATYVGPSELFTALQPEVAAGGKYADLVCTTQWAYGYLIGANLMMDLNELEVNWDNSWWNQNIRRISTIQGKTYAGNGSFIFDAAQTYMFYYNRDIWNELGLPDAEKLVRDGQWTLAKCREFCMKANRDQDGNGVVDTIDDRWGLVAPAGDFARALYMGLGGRYFATDPDTGHVKLACNNNETYAIVEQMYDFQKRDKSTCPDKFQDWPSLADVFVSGNALFLSTGCQVAELKNMEADWGAMPMPKFDENQEKYLSCVDHNSCVFGVTSSNTAKHEVGIILEALGRHCKVLEEIYWPDYKETYWRTPADAAIVADYVVGSGQYDLAILMQNCESTFSSPMSRVFATAFGAAGPDFSSYIDAVEETINLKIDEFFAYE